MKLFLLKSLLLLLIVHQEKFLEALNCRTFSPKDAKFTVETFHQIDLAKSGSKSKDKIVQEFVEAIRKQISEGQNAIDEPNTVEQNARKMITIATDMCYRLPSKNKSPAFLNCVNFLLYHHMQKLVWQLENKWGIINFEEKKGKKTNKNSLLEVYTTKKMNEWQEMVKGYQDELNSLSALNDRIRRKFGFCLIIEGDTQFKCKAISIENAQLFTKYFHKISFEPEFERNRSKKAELLAIHIFNSLRTEQRKDEQQKQEQNEEDKIMAKNWKLAEPSMRVRVQVLVNTAERKCRKLTKDPLRIVKKMNRKFQKTDHQESAANTKKNANEKVKKNKSSNANGDDPNATDGENESENARDELSSDFVTCIYHYMYAFSENLITKIEEKSVENDKKLKEIYKKLRGKTRKRMELLFKIEGLNEMDKWLNGEKQTASSSSIDEIEIENDEAEEEEEEDPFHNCANVVEDQVEEDNTVQRGYGGLMDKSFDDFLFECAGQFIEAVAEDQFDYKLFVNLYTMQLDTTMEFPWSMKDNGKMPTKNGQNAKDKCQMMRELLLSLNRNLAHRLNFEKITSRNEKEHFVSLQERYGNLRLEKMDKNWLQRMGLKMLQKYESLRLLNGFGTLTHPIRDKYREVRKVVEHAMDNIAEQYQSAREEVREKIGLTPKKESLKTADSIQSVRERKTLKDLLEEKENDENQSESERKQSKDFLEKNDDTTVFRIMDSQESVNKIELKMQEIQTKIAENSLAKRLNVYKIIFRAFYIALAIELFDKMQNQENWHFMVRDDEQTKSDKVTEKDRQNVKKIQEQKQIFDQIMTRMGKKMQNNEESAAHFNWHFWNKKSLASEETPPPAIESKNENEAEDKEIGLGHELRFMGYVMENNGEELLETLKDEIKLNLDQFNISFDGQCDLTNDLSDCFAASDGLDFVAQIAQLSFTGKPMDEMGVLQKAAESCFKKLNRQSYRLGEKQKQHKNMLRRFMNRTMANTVGLYPKLMTGEESPFEIFIPFYRPIKKIVKFSARKVVVEPSKTFRAWMLRLFADANVTINQTTDEQLENAEIEEVELSQIEPSIDYPNNQLLGKQLNPILQKMTKMEEEKSDGKTKNKNKLLATFKKFVEPIKDLFIKFVLERKLKKGEKSENNMKKQQRRKKRGIGGAGMTAYTEDGKPGSATLEALLIDVKLVETTLTTPLPGVQLHWIHFNHAVMLGKYNLAWTFVTGFIVIFVITSFIYWWHALMMSVNLANRHGELMGWATLFMATAFYLVFFWLFFIL